MEASRKSALKSIKTAGRELSKVRVALGSVDGSRALLDDAITSAAEAQMKVAHVERVIEDLGRPAHGPGDGINFDK